MLHGCQIEKCAPKSDVYGSFSSFFPRPFSPNCFIDSIPFSLQEVISEDIVLAYKNLHNSLYKDLDLSFFVHQKSSLLELLRKGESDLRIWMSNRLLIDEAYYHLLEKNLSIGVALAERSVSQAESLDIVSQIDALTILANLQYHFLSHDASLSTITEAERLIFNISDPARNRQVLYLKVMNLNNMDRLEEAAILLDSIDVLCESFSYDCHLSIHLRGINSYFKNDVTNACALLINELSSQESFVCKSKYSYSRSALDLANIYRRAKDFNRAEKFYELALDIYNDGHSINGDFKKGIFNVSLLSGKVELLVDRSLDLDNQELAMEAYGYLVKIGSLLRQSAKYDRDTHIQNEYFHNFYYSNVVKICVFLFETTKDKVWLKNILNHLSYYKSSSLLRDLKMSNLVASDNHSITGDLKRYTDIDKNLERLFHSSVKLDDDIDKSQARIELIVERENLFRSIAEESNVFKSERIPLEDHASIILNQSYEDSVARIYYYVGADLYNNNKAHGIVVFNGEIDHFEILDCSKLLDKIDVLHSWFNDESSKVAAKEYAELTFQLYNSLLYPAIKICKNAKRIHIVPDNTLNTLPFGSLSTSDENFDHYSDMPYFIYDADISYGYLIPDVNSSLNSKRKKMAKEKKTYVAFGWSDVETIVESSLTELPELPGSFLEVRSIENIVNPVDQIFQFTGNDATLANFRKYSPMSDVLHLAMHAKAESKDRQSPEVYFRNNGYVDTLYQHNLMYKNIAPSLTILSACDSNKGQLEESEGIFSLSRVFFKNGSDHVISNMWQLEDSFAADLFSRFYSHLGESNDYVTALSNSKRSYLKECELEECFPDKWAGLVIYM